MKRLRLPEAKKYTVYFIFCLCSIQVNSQRHLDTNILKSKIIFGKVSGIFSKEFRPDLFGKWYASYSQNSFIENKFLRSSKKELHRCGLLYYKFQRYCKENTININLKELKRYRRSATLSAFLYGLAVIHPVFITIDAVNYANNTYNYNKFPKSFFVSKAAPYLWTIYFAEWYATLTIKSRAEKRLRKRIFIEDGFVK